MNTIKLTFQYKERIEELEFKTMGKFLKYIETMVDRSQEKGNRMDENIGIIFNIDFNDDESNEKYHKIIDDKMKENLDKQVYEWNKSSKKINEFFVNMLIWYYLATGMGVWNNGTTIDDIHIEIYKERGFNQRERDYIWEILGRNLTQYDINEKI